MWMQNGLRRWGGNGGYMGQEQIVQVCNCKGNYVIEGYKVVLGRF